MQPTKENKMGTMPIDKLLITMSLPMIIAMMVQAGYNLVDSYFVAQIGENAQTAVSLAFPIQMIIIACFAGLGIGINSAVSRKLGEKDVKTATLVAEHGYFLGFVLYIIIVLIGLVVPIVFFNKFTNTMEVIEYGIAYITTITTFSFGRIFAQVGMSILQGTGNTIMPMCAQLLGAFLNMILDPIMIFGYFGFPALGVRGAAIATVTGQIISMIFITIMLIKNDKIIKMNLREFKLKRNIITQVISVGIPSIVMQALASVMLIGLNFILKGFTETAIAVLGVYFKVQSFVFMPVFGLSTGAIPIIGYNYGAKNKDRLLKTVKLASIMAISYMSVGFIVFQLYPLQIIKIFSSSQGMETIGVYAFKIISLIFPLAAISIILSATFQGVGKAYISLVVSSLRQIVILLPAAYLLGKVVGLNGVWYSFLIAEIIGLSVVVICYYNIVVKTKFKSE